MNEDGARRKDVETSREMAISEDSITISSPNE